ncbi:MAG: protein-L-isoaspartate O-methyltransferase [Alphaproteobacteria bacterium]|nr:protein-L-isoaspartate O-methyltransferase [Alphaproteobacteria bacterium]MBU6472152.1 protein-L-isoaspartate O-methyltransferase [Alphaproteobacteria bacterium]MDE2011766.1 protein-L-isoaspartate O-methyltransferase [Alphaproteobacteria bacterium]MDE2074898.1 protein-L-isoaspartate O-methyltransferase [Alphaproteobacteria bacterium]MDE2352914.1 protein-L-isoaspartate O-methyltransferase [Alphaproteobacteria bacterium]
MPDYTAQRVNMVESQVRTSDVPDPRIQNAMLEVPRERFVPAAKRDSAYAEAAVEVVHGRHLLEPRTLAKLIRLAEVGEGDTVLDVGCTSGYSCAVLARLAKKVYGLESDAELVRVASEMLPAVGVTNAEVVQGGLREGHRAAAPYDVIVIEGAVEEVPDGLLAQLAEGGRLVAMVQKGPQIRAYRYVRHDGHIGSRGDFDGAAPLLAAFRKPVGFVL